MTINIINHKSRDNKRNDINICDGADVVITDDKSIAKAVSMTKSELKSALSASTKALDEVKNELTELTDEHNRVTLELANMNIDVGKIESMCAQLLTMAQSLQLDPAEVNKTMLQELVINKRRLTEFVPSLLN